MWTSGGHFHTHVDRHGRLLIHMTWGTSALVARSLSVSANVCRGAEALFPGQGKQIVGPFANEKKRERAEKESRKWRKVLSLTGRPGLHIHDFQFNSEEVEGINWRGEIEYVHVGKIHY